MHGHIRDPVIPVQVDGQAMRHVEHVRSPTRLDGARLCVQHVDGVLLDGPVLNKVVYIALVECAAKVLAMVTSLYICTIYM